MSSNEQEAVQLSAMNLEEANKKKANEDKANQEAANLQQMNIDGSTPQPKAGDKKDDEKDDKKEGKGNLSKGSFDAKGSGDPSGTLAPLLELAEEIMEGKYSGTGQSPKEDLESLQKGAAKAKDMAVNGAESTKEFAGKAVEKLGQACNKLREMMPELGKGEENKKEPEDVEMTTFSSSDRDEVDEDLGLDQFNSQDEDLSEKLGPPGSDIELSTFNK